MHRGIGDWAYRNEEFTKNKKNKGPDFSLCIIQRQLKQERKAVSWSTGRRQIVA